VSYLQESDNANNKYEAIINSLKNITHPGKVFFFLSTLKFNIYVGYILVMSLKDTGYL